MKDLIKRSLPNSWVSALQGRWRTIKHDRDRKTLAGLPRATADVSPLRPADTLRPADLFSAVESPAWLSAHDELTRAGVGDVPGGVNPGDQRAIYQLIRYLRPRSVLEFGTHIGASTSHIAIALRQLMEEEPRVARSLTTVDILDVNDATLKNWARYGTPRSPKAIIEQIRCGALVSFVTQPALEFARRTMRKFDFIFLDGDHAAIAVYEEIPAALKMLAPNGVILLHDYFPGVKPLWPGSSPIEGPALAVQRLRADGVGLEVLPLGALPWPTKKGTHVTSLALVARAPAAVLSAVA
jgi:predicted O-methyltransferase YrrM